jgi:hypothetical protein
LLHHFIWSCVSGLILFCDGSDKETVSVHHVIVKKEFRQIASNSATFLSRVVTGDSWAPTLKDATQVFWIELTNESYLRIKITNSHFLLNSVENKIVHLFSSDVLRQERPERLISQLRKTYLEETGPKLTVIRRPRGPDGTKGFDADVRQPHAPGFVVE